MPICIHKSLDDANIFLSTSPLKGISIRIMIFGLFIECLLCVYFNTQQDFGCLKLRFVSNSHDAIPKTLNICQTKDTVVRVYLALSQYIASKDSISMDHASLSVVTRSLIQHRYQHTDVLRCVVATVALVWLISVRLLSLIHI